MTDLFLGSTIETEQGLAAISGCDGWPTTVGPNTVPRRCRVAAVDDDGAAVLLRRDGDRWEKL